MHEPVEENEVAVEVSLDHAFDVELNESRLRESRGVSHESEPPAVRRQAPERVCAVEVLLNSGVGAASPRGTPLVQVLFKSDHVYRRCVRVVAEAMRNEERLASSFDRSALGL